MFGSDHDGERASAALKAHGILTKHKLCWSDVLTASALPPPPDPPPADQSHAVSAAWALGADRTVGVLTDWERQFLRSIQGFRKITERQRGTLDALVEKVSAAVEEAHG